METIGAFKFTEAVNIEYMSREEAVSKSLGGLDMRADMVPGAKFPDYELSDHRGTR